MRDASSQATQVKEAIDSALQLAAEPLLNTLSVREVLIQGGSLLVVAEPRIPGNSLDISIASKALKQATPMLTHTGSILLSAIASLLAA